MFNGILSEPYADNSVVSQTATVINSRIQNISSVAPRGRHWEHILAEEGSLRLFPPGSGKGKSPHHSQPPPPRPGAARAKTRRKRFKK